MAWSPRRWPPAPHRVVVLALALLTCAACATLPVHRSPFVASRAVVWVQDHWVALRLSRPRTLAPRRPLVVFITGDGGWRGKDLEAFDQLRGWGYAVAGMSAPEYLSPVRIEDGIPPQVVADDISAVASTARKALRLPGTTPVVLFGVSRGADLAAVAAARPSLRGSVRGVLVVGLTAEEEFVRLARPYDALRFVTAPVCLIQSTNDEYVPAADARRLFGLNSNERKFQAIESRDHSFSDARGELYGAMLQSLQWVESRAAVPGAP